MSDYYILITDAGAALEASAHASGTTVKLAKFSVCDGGVDFIPDPTATTFPDVFPPIDISSLTVSADDATVMVAQCIIPGSSGGYTIRGIAIYTDDGTLYATGNYPAQPKPAPDSGYAASLEILAQLAVSDTSDVTLSVKEGNFLTETQGNTLYLRQDKRLSEIADAGETAQAKARDNLALGELATKDSLTAADVGALPDTYTPPAAPVTSVNSKTGAVNLTAADVGALPDTYTPPVTSVNGMTGAVTISAPDLSGYETIADANARFVTATRFGANMSTSWGSGGGTVPAGCALTGGDYNSESEYPIYAYLQYCVNGVWINATGGVGGERPVSATHYRSVPKVGVSRLTNLRPYNPDKPKLPGAQHYIDESGLDWFEAAPALRGAVFIAYSPDTGVILQIADSSLPDTDAYSLHPHGVNVAGLDSLPEGCDIDGSWKFDGETVYQDAAIASDRIYQRNLRQRDGLLTKCAAYAFAVQSGAALGNSRPGASEALQQYADALLGVDLTLAEPDWPEIPAPMEAAR